MAPSRAPEASSADADPIIASYSVFIKPPLPSSRKLLILQQPNKAAASVPYGDAVLPLTELRLKPEAGIVEADVRIDTAEQYDRAKGVAWGAAMQKSAAVRAGGSHGLAGGFGSARPVRGRGAPGGQGDGEDAGEEVVDWGDAVRQDKVLTTRTLGGQAPELTDCTVMVGVFEGDSLHLTPATNHIQLRTQLHHLDAIAEQDKANRQTAGAGGPGSGGNAQDTGSKPATSSARAIHMTIKASGGAEGDAPTTETMADRLRRVQREPWVRMRYADENSDEAWEMYAESLLVRPDPEIENSNGASAARDAKGKGKEVGGAAGAESDLKDKVPQLEATWDDEQFLQAVSGMKGRITGGKPTKEDDDAVEVKHEDGKETAKAKEVAAKAGGDDPTPKTRRPGRPPRGGARAAATSAGTRAGSTRSAKGASVSTPMELD